MFCDEWLILQRNYVTKNREMSLQDSVLDKILSFSHLLWNTLKVQKYYPLAQIGTV